MLTYSLANAISRLACGVMAEGKMAAFAQSVNYVKNRILLAYYSEFRNVVFCKGF